jgi:hypothetical protein
MFFPFGLEVGRAAGGRLHTGFGSRFEAVEDSGPKRIEVRFESDYAGRIDPVDTLRAGVPITDQPSILEDAQVLGDGWPTNRKAPRQFDHR